ncbi:MAG: hypothetical protein ACWA6X_00190 [Bauldia sp.]
MPTAELIKSVPLPNGRTRRFILVTFDAADRAAAKRQRKLALWSPSPAPTAAPAQTPKTTPRPPLMAFL